MDEQFLTEEDGDEFVLYEDEILQVLDLGDDQPVNGVGEEMADQEMEEEDDLLEEGDIDPSGSAAMTATVKDDAIGCFLNHTASVFSVALHPDGKLAVTGGEDDKAFVWKIVDGSCSMSCTGHRDSVTCTGFSHDGNYVATGDMAGLVQVWKLSSGQLVWSYECGDLEWLRWHPQSLVLLAGTSDGLGWMWRMPSGECKCFQGPAARNTCLVIMPDGKRACFGYENGQSYVWDLKTATYIESKYHSSSLTCVEAHPDNQLILTCSEGSRACLVNSFSGKLLCKFEPDTKKTSVESASFCPSTPLAATGSLSGTMAIWDIPSQSLRHKCTHPEGVVRVQWSHVTPHLVFTACLDGMVRLWDARSGSTVHHWEGHRGQILDMCVSRDDSIIATACDDHRARIFPCYKPSQ